MSTFHTSQLLLLDSDSALLETEAKIPLIKQVSLEYLKKHYPNITATNVTFFNEDFINFPIEEVRTIQVAAQYSSSFSGQGQRAFVLLNFETAGAPAQNAALKLLEESPAETLILIPIYELGSILPTIISRCHIISLSPGGQKLPTSDFSLPKNIAEAITLAEQYKDRNQALMLIGNLLRQENQSTQAKKILLQSYQDLRRNQNVQLALENCFFSLVDLSTSL